MAQRVRLDFPDDRGKSLRPLLEAVWEQRRRARPGADPEELRPPELVEPTVPPGGERLWRDFWELSVRRGTGPWGGPAPLAYHEIYARARLLRRMPRPWELRILLDMDRAFQEALAGLRKE